MSKKRKRTRFGQWSASKWFMFGREERERVLVYVLDSASFYRELS